MFWCLVRLFTGALSGGLYANPLEMVIQSAVACSEAKEGGLLVSWELMECVLVWAVCFSLGLEDEFLMNLPKLGNKSQNRICYFLSTSLKVHAAIAAVEYGDDDNKKDDDLFAILLLSLHLQLLLPLQRLLLRRRRLIIK